MENHIWYKKYPEGIKHSTGELKFTSVPELFTHSVEKYGNQTGYENFGTSLTFSELDKYSSDFAAYLHSLGLKKGDRIAIQMPNLLQYPIVLFGAIKLGLIVVNTNPLYTPREMKHQFNDAEVSALVVLANFAFNVETVIADTKIKHVIVTEIGDMVPGIKGTIMNLVVKYIKKMIPSYSLPGKLSFKHALKDGAKSSFPKPEITHDDVLFLQYTGGTTGVSKGAVLTHGNILAHTQIIQEWFKPLLKEGRTEIIVTAIPLYHIFALTVNGIFGLSLGMKNVLITNPRDLDGFMKDLSKYQFSLITGVNTLFNGMMNHPKFKDLDFSKLGGSVSGGMALLDYVARKWQTITNSPLVEGYGLSETSLVLCCNPLDGTHKLGYIGLPVPDTEVAIFDENGKTMALGEIGEICGRGPQVMKGYWKRDNEGVFYEGGWFRTGDLGIMDEDGFIKIVDRIKDMINVSGFNVYPNEVENVVADNEKVLEVAAIGVPHEKSVECVKIFVVKSDPSLTEDELMEYCKENLTGYKVPKYIEFRKDLPKSNIGKIIRRILKEEEEAKRKEAV